MKVYRQGGWKEFFSAFARFISYKASGFASSCMSVTFLTVWLRWAKVEMGPCFMAWLEVHVQVRARPCLHNLVCRVFCNIDYPLGRENKGKEVQP